MNCQSTRIINNYYYQSFFMLLKLKQLHFHCNDQITDKDMLFLIKYKLTISNLVEEFLIFCSSVPIDGYDFQQESIEICCLYPKSINRSHNNYQKDS